MRKLLVFQHVASEPLGHLDPLLRASGVRIRFVNFGREPHAQPDVRRYDGLVVLGGPMNVDQADHLPHLRFEMAAIRDAMACGRPVLTSDVSSLPDVVGDGAVLVDPYRVEDIADGLVAISESESLWAELSRRALERAALYSWTRTADLTCNSYRKALADCT